MSSATVSLFASFAIAAVGAAGLAYTLTHPGILVAVLGQVKTPATDAARVEPDTSAEEDTVSQRSPAGTVTLPAGAYGHFLATAEINGRNTDVMVDTGATLVALTYEDAGRAGIFVNPKDFTGTASTANGITRVAPVLIPRIQIGDITVRNVPAVVSQRGASDRTLLGMSFLGRLSRVEMRGGTLILEE